jgi:hypothetical protein
MTSFTRSCRQCYIERGFSIPLIQDLVTGTWMCPQNPKHVTPEDDIIVL